MYFTLTACDELSKLQNLLHALCPGQSVDVSIEELKSRLASTCEERDYSEEMVKQLLERTVGPSPWVLGYVGDDSKSLVRKPTYPRFDLPHGGFSWEAWDDRQFDSSVVDCIATALYLSRVGKEDNDSTASWREFAGGKEQQDKTMRQLLVLLRSDWAAHEADHLILLKMKFYTYCREIMYMIDLTAVPSQDAWKEDIDMAELWTRLSNEGLPWQFQVDVLAECHPCRKRQKVKTARKGTIGAQDFAKASIAGLLNDFFLPPVSSGRPNPGGLPKCSHCGIVELTDPVPYVAGDLPPVLVLNFSTAEFCGDVTPSWVPVRFLGADRKFYAVDYQWLWSICKNDPKGDEGYRLYYSDEKEGSALSYNPASARDGRIKRVRLMGKTAGPFESPYLQSTIIVALERKPPEPGMLSYSQLWARNFGNESGSLHGKGDAGASRSKLSTKAPAKEGHGRKRAGSDIHTSRTKKARIDSNASREEGAAALDALPEAWKYGAAHLRMPKPYKDARAHFDEATIAAVKKALDP